MNSTTLFSAQEIMKLRNPVKFPINCPHGWSKSKVNPKKVLKNFSKLRIKKGFVLRSYHFQEKSNGNSIVWAMPKQSPFPSPDSCPKLTDTFLHPPKPPLALDDLMEAIESDGSPWSYLSASIFKREISEFGAFWHGHNWDTHNIIDTQPLFDINQIQEKDEINSAKKVDKWEWLEAKPEQWMPSVSINNEQAIVTFFTYSELGTKAIYIHTDTYNLGKYSCKTEKIMIAKGGSGYHF